MEAEERTFIFTCCKLYETNNKKIDPEGGVCPNISIFGGCLKKSHKKRSSLKAPYQTRKQS